MSTRKSNLDILHEALQHADAASIDQLLVFLSGEDRTWLREGFRRVAARGLADGGSFPAELVRAFCAGRKYEQIFYAQPKTCGMMHCTEDVAAPGEFLCLAHGGKK